MEFSEPLIVKREQQITYSALLILKLFTVHRLPCLSVEAL